jgi:hypothetical protein
MEIIFRTPCKVQSEHGKRVVIVIAGMGWVSRNEFGSVLGKLCRPYADTKSLHSYLQQDSALLFPIKNFRRFDVASKRTCGAVALALFDAGLHYSACSKLDMGILGTNSIGCHQANVQYFKDYLETGRVLGRGNLFIYTLPSSPLAEAAIHFGLQGPLLYLQASKDQTATVLLHAGSMIAGDEAAGMLAVVADEQEALAFVLMPQEKQRCAGICGLEDAVRLSRDIAHPKELVREFIAISSQPRAGRLSVRKGKTGENR